MRHGRTKKPSGTICRHDVSAAVERAEKIENHAEGSDEEEEYLALSEAIEAYEHARWPSGRLRKK
jgi:hypothetical protein